ncbi:Talin-1 [Trichinella zimbabwensis]|uniref:Talin-1 n=1 Tax=Trichinella zimbabwensis TaxID=268475 RepID=A0A0V1H205_9BILA|nr:Talin-1 [Trichinella zimbabwensis]
MAILSLKVRVAEKGVLKTIQFDPTTIVYDACKIIREKVLAEAQIGPPKDYGLFLADDDPKKGVWMENGKTLEYYLIRSGDLLEYKKKIRTLKVRMLDGAVKTLMVDDSLPVGQLMIVICARIGITNHDEYSLVRDLPQETEKVNTLKKDDINKLGTLTLGRSKEKKMEQLRKQLHTDEELNWIDHSKTLREQGVDENETVLLRRKFFFSDQNIDSRDPVQLNLLYVQCRDGILDGTHPVTKDEAVQFASLQCQIQFGDYVEAKHRQGFLDLHEFLPKDYARSRDIERRIYQEYRGLRGMPEVEAKVEYVKRCRDLKTYGVTFFLVKEKMKGKNRLVPRLLGVNKDCVMRVDERTKEVLKVYPLEQVRRWAASPNTFTLDFGDYQDAYYSVQTTEGEKIGQLIGGYIDIILRKKRAKDHFGIEGDEGSTMLEDVVTPAKATLMSHGLIKENYGLEGNVAMPAIIRPGMNGEIPYNTGSLQRAQFGAVSGQVTSATMAMGQKPKVMDMMTRSQRALIGTIEASIRNVERVEEDLRKKVEFPQLGDDLASKKWKVDEMDVQKQSVTDHLAAMGAATAQVIKLTGAVPEKVDHTAVGAAISTISSNIPNMAKGVKTIAGLMEEEDRSSKLLDATRKLCRAITDMLGSVSPGKPQPRQTVLAAAGRVGDFSHAMIQTIEQPDDTARDFQDILVQLAKNVATGTAHLVLKAKAVSSKCDQQPLQDKVIHSATQCAFATSQLVACARVVAPTIESPACQEQLTEAAKQVARAVEQLLKDAELLFLFLNTVFDLENLFIYLFVFLNQLSCKDEKSVHDLKDAASQVSRALTDLLNHIKTGPERAQAATEHGKELDKIISTTDKLISYTGSANEMIRQAKVLAEATTHLVTHIRGEADVQSEKEHLLTAAKRLADATTRMIEAAKACAGVPDNVSHQVALKAAAEDVRMATTEAAEAQLRRQVVHALEHAAKQTVSSATQVLTAVQVCDSFNANVQSRESLQQNCTQVSEIVNPLMTALKHCQSQPNDRTYQLELLSVCQEALLPCGRLVNNCRSSMVNISEPSASMQLSSSTKTLAEALAELRVAVTKAQNMFGGVDLASAIEIVRHLNEELVEIGELHSQNLLRPSPGETPEFAASRLTSATKVVGSSVAQLLSAGAQGDQQYVNSSASEVTGSLRQLVHSARMVCANMPDVDGRRLVDVCRTVLDKVLLLLEEIQRCLEHPTEPDNQQRLAQIAKALTYSLNSCVNCLPGQQDVDSAVRGVTSLLEMISLDKLTPSVRSSAEVQDDLHRCASMLTEVTNRLVSATIRQQPHLGGVADEFLSCLRRLVTVAMELIHHCPDPSLREQMLQVLRVVVDQAIRLLLAVKAYGVNPNAANAKQQLTFAARSLTDSINRLVDVYTSGAPWQKECDNAIRNMQAVYNLLDYPNQTINSLSYFECFDMVTEYSKNLGEGMSGITHHAKQGDLVQFCESVRAVSDAVCGLGETAAQAAYLVGVADLSSIPGHPAVVDLNRFNESTQAVAEACHKISSCKLNQAQILEAATVIAKQTTLLANICRDASSQTSDSGAKRHFINYARDVAGSTANLIKAIKVLDHDFNDNNLTECSRCTQPLLSSLDNLSAFVMSPEFAGLPTKIAEAGRRAQKPIVDAGRLMVDGSIEMIQTSKLLALNAKDPPAWQLLATCSKNVSDSIKGLISAIRERAPGQSECDRAIEQITSLIHLLDQASLAAINQSLEHSSENTEQAFYELIDNNSRQILDRIPGVQNAAKREAENIGHRMRDIVAYFEPLTNACIGAASLSINSRRQIALLDQCKTVLECQLQLLYSTKDAAGNPKAKEFQSGVDESGQSLVESIGELLQTVSEAISEAGSVSTLLDEIRKAISLTDEEFVQEVGDYADYQTRMIHYCKLIIDLAQEMVAKSYSNVEEIGALATELTKNYCMLANDARGACAAASSSEVAQKIRVSVQELGTACIELIKHAGACRANPQDHFSKQDLAYSARRTTEEVAMVLAALRFGARGTQACINAASTVSGIIGDLDTTIMFATAGTLNPEREGEVFSDHREAILRTAKALVEDTKALVSGAASSQEQLAVAAQNAVRTIVQLSEVVKSGAAALTSSNSEAQVLVINAVKDVAAALSHLIQATKSASGKSFNDPAMNSLKEAAKVMVTNVTSLLKTVKTVEDEHQRGTRALEAAIEAIGQEIRAYDSSEQPTREAKPEELIRVTKPITDATAKAVAAGQSCQQDDVIAAANMSRRVVSDLLNSCRAVAFWAETPDARYRCLDAGRDVAIKVRELLQALNTVLQKPTNEFRQLLTPASRLIAQAVTDLVAQVELLKGSDWVDPSDPAVIAENELLGAASSIEAAARRLAQLKPRPQAREANESLNFDEQILEAAKSIATAVTALVKAASAAQRELVAQGRVDPRPTLQTDDYQWSEGLISAARMVAAATHSLCESANALVQGHATEEKLISAAKQVAASTAHLLVACKVKADMNSKVMRRLQAAGNAVKTATEHLVRAARQAIEIEDERTLIISQRMVSGIAQVLDAQEEVLRKERELEEARVKLAAIRKAKYKDRPMGSSHEGSPEVMYYSDY